MASRNRVGQCVSALARGRSQRFYDRDDGATLLRHELVPEPHPTRPLPRLLRQHATRRGVDQVSDTTVASENRTRHAPRPRASSRATTDSVSYSSLSSCAEKSGTTSDSPGL